MSDPDDPRNPDEANDQSETSPESPDRGPSDGTGAADSGLNDGDETAYPAPSGGESIESGRSADEELAGTPESAEGDRPPENDGEDGGRRRRLIWLLLLLLLVLVGGGVGTFVLEDQPDTTPGVQTPTETAVPTATPVAGNVSLTADANATLLRADGVVPGDEGVSRMALRNDGAAIGELAVASLSVESDENGITGAEASADDSPAEGELAENLLVRLSVRYSGAETVRVFGGGAFVPLADIEARNRTVGSLAAGEEVTVVFEWRLPTETGNEVQSDTARFDVVFGLRNSTDGTPGQ